MSIYAFTRPLSSTFSYSSAQVIERLTPLQTTFLFFSCYSDEMPFLFFFLSFTRHASSVSFPPDISSIELGFDVNHQKPMPGLCLCVEWTPLLKMTHPVFLTVCSQSPTLMLWHELSPAALQQPSSGSMFGPWGPKFPHFLCNLAAIRKYVLICNLKTRICQNAYIKDK